MLSEWTNLGTEEDGSSGQRHLLIYFFKHTYACTHAHTYAYRRATHAQTHTPFIHIPSRLISEELPSCSIFIIQGGTVDRWDTYTITRAQHCLSKLIGWNTGSFLFSFSFFLSLHPEGWYMTVLRDTSHWQAGTPCTLRAHHHTKGRPKQSHRSSRDFLQHGFHRHRISFCCSSTNTHKENTAEASRDPQ